MSSVAAASEVHIRLQSGPQERAGASRADVLFFGGAAGSGKSRFLCHDAGRHYDKPGYDAIIFRRETTELRGGGGIWDESYAIYPHLGGVPREQMLEWRFPSGARVEFRHMQFEHDRFAHQSKQYAYIGWDEVCHFASTQFWYLLSRSRSTCGVRPLIRATCNPDPDSFVASLISWWIGADGFPLPGRSGVLRWFVRDQESDELIWADRREELSGVAAMLKTQPLSMTFIGGKLEDNRILMAKDPGYESRLNALTRVDRERLRHGNWLVRATAGDYFRPEWFRFVDSAPTDVTSRVRAWDKAGATDKGRSAKQTEAAKAGRAFTVGVRMALLRDRRVVVEDVQRFQGTPLENEQRIRATAELDGRGVEVAIWQDPGQAGESDADRYVREVLSGFAAYGVPARENKEAYAKPLSAQAEAGNVLLLRGEWTPAYVSELHSFPLGRLKDQVDASSLAYLRLTGGASSAAPSIDPDVGHMGSAWDA